MEERSKILIVDDKSESIHRLEQILSKANVEIIGASNANGALAAILKHHFVLAVIDVQISGTDGYSLAASIRSKDKTSGLPILFVCAGCSNEYPVFKGCDSGAVDFLVKPVDAGILLSKVNLFLTLDQQTRQLERSANLIQENMALKRELEKRKETEHSIVKARAEWQELFDAIGHMALVLDGDHNILSVNQPAIKQLGRLPEELIGKKCHEIFHDDNELHAKCPAKNITGPNEEHMGELDFESMGKSFIVSCTPIFDEDGALKKIIHIMTDISERKRLEKDLIEAHKMEAIGTLAGGIAHDFNNILSGLLGYTQLILNDIEKGTTLEKDLNKVYSSGLRAKELVRQILTFARKSEDEKMSLRLDLIVKDVLKFLRSSLPANIVIKDHIDSRSKVMANATQVHQVVMGLCTNAGQAMDATGGTLDIALNDRFVDDSQTRLLGSISPGEYLELTVSDTGPGIPAAIMDRIFEPYFTTKDPKDGTGMGLALVQSIVKEAKGVIQVESEVNRGTRFKILFPTTHEEKPCSRPLPDKPLKGKAHILLVDDEIFITKLGRRCLERYGYSVTTANNPLEALTAFSKNPDDFDAVVTDLTMPDMKGDRLIAEIRDIRAGFPCILCTGYSKEFTENCESMEGGTAVLIKPIEPNELVAAVQHLLNKKAAQGNLPGDTP